MAKTKTVEIWVVIDEDGDYDVAAGADDAATRYGENVAEFDGSRGIRRVKITLTVPLPAPIELAADVSGGEPATTLVAAHAA